MSRLRDYIAQRLDIDGNAKQEFLLDITGKETWDVDLALVRKSRLGIATVLRQIYETDEEERWGWIIVPKDTIEKSPEPFEPVDLAGLIRPDPLEVVKLTFSLHHEYCDKLEAWLRQAGIDLTSHQRPEIQMTVTGPSWAGVYTGDHICHYPVAYGMFAPDWQVTVAHEVCHAYQKVFTGHRASHGGDFYALMKHAAKHTIRRHTHDYDVKLAKRIAEQLRPWWIKQRVAGRLTTLPCVVEQDPKKRKGIG